MALKVLVKVMPGVKGLVKVMHGVKGFGQGHAWR
jgi:hypothetical protein